MGIFVQAAILLAIGTAIGLADSRLRPVTIGRNVSAELDVPQPKPTPPPTNNAAAANTTNNTTLTAPTPNPAQPVSPTSPTSPTQTPTPATNPPVQPAPAPAPTGGAFVPTPKDQLPKGQITLAEAKAAFDSGATNFVDARTRADFAAGHIPGAVRLQLEDFVQGIPAKLGLLSREAQTIVYCNGGHCDESERVAERLEGAGYSRIFIIHDGFPGWKALGYEVEISEDIE